MSIYQTTKDDIALALTASTGLTITSSMFTIAAFRPSTAQESTRNTKAHVIFTASSPVRGAADVYYDRLSLTGLRKIRNPNAPLTARIDAGVSVYTAFAQLRDEYGALFTAEDLEEAVSYFEGSDCKILLKAKTSSPGWLGEDVVSFGSAPLISSMFTTTYLPEL